MANIAKVLLSYPARSWISSGADDSPATSQINTRPDWSPAQGRRARANGKVQFSNDQHNRSASFLIPIMCCRVFASVLELSPTSFLLVIQPRTRSFERPACTTEPFIIPHLSALPWQKTSLGLIEKLTFKRICVLAPGKSSHVIGIGKWLHLGRAWWWWCWLPSTWWAELDVGNLWLFNRWTGASTWHTGFLEWLSSWSVQQSFH